MDGVRWCRRWLYPLDTIQALDSKVSALNDTLEIQESWMFSSWLTSSKPPKNRVVQSSSRSFDSEEWESFEALSLALDVLAGQANRPAILMQTLDVTH